MVGLKQFDLLLFVTGEPDSGVGSLRDVKFRSGSAWFFGELPMGRKLRSTPDANTGGMGARSPLSGERPWHIPPQQIHCIDLVVDAAHQLGREVTVVDVDRPGELQGLVDYWVGPNDVMPMLLRPDGSRLRGIEAFVRRRVRRFIGGGGTLTVGTESAPPNFDGDQTVNFSK